MKFIKPLNLYKPSGDKAYVNLNTIITNHNWAHYELFFKKDDLHLHYITSINFKNKTTKNELRSHTFNSNLNETTQFIKILKRHGLLLKYNLVTTKLINLHRSFFENLNAYFSTFYKDYLGFYIYSQNNEDFFNFNFLLTFIASILNPCIQLKVVKLPKFIQKKFKKKYDFKIKHIPTPLRKRYVFKRIVIYSGFTNHKSLKDRVYLTLVETFLNPETNLLHKERLNFYKYVMKAFRFGKLNFQTL